MDWLTRHDFEEARRLAAPSLHRTPLLSFRTLAKEIGAPAARLKCENLQKTGSFKVRGALASIAALREGRPSGDPLPGVVTVSAGNHAQAVAWAARKAGTEAVVVMPEKASPAKVAAARGYGAKVVLRGNAADAFEEARRLGARDGFAFLHPFDSAPVVAGHGSTGLEVDEEMDGPAAVVVPVGGGGQIAGIAGALAAAGRLGATGRPSAASRLARKGAGGRGDRAGRTGGQPGARGWRVTTPDETALAGRQPVARSWRVFGVEPEGAPAMRRSLDLGRPARLEATDTIADGLAPPFAGELNYRYVARFVEDVVLVSDAEILSAMRLLLTRAKLVAEPSGAAAVAALMHGRIPLAPGEAAVAVVTGGNADPEVVVRALREGAPWP